MVGGTGKCGTAISIRCMESVYGIHANGRIRPSHQLCDLRSDTDDLVVIHAPGGVIVNVGCHVGVNGSVGQVVCRYGISSLNGIVSVCRVSAYMGAYLIDAIGLGIGYRGAGRGLCRIGRIIIRVETVSTVFIYGITECIGYGSFCYMDVCINACLIVCGIKDMLHSIRIHILIGKRAFDLAGSAAA